MSRAVIGRWGKNLAIRFPNEVVRDAGFSEGERVEIVAAQGDVVIRKLPADEIAESLFAGKSAEEWRALYQGAYDWGPDVGRERLDE